MSDLEQLLGIDGEDPQQRLAIILVREDNDLLDQLRKLRQRKGLTQRHIAERLGIAQETVSAFERLGNDPRLSTIRRYAAAVGAVVEHSVKEFDPSLDAVRRALDPVGGGAPRPEAHDVLEDVGRYRSRRTSAPDWSIHG